MPEEYDYYVYLHEGLDGGDDYVLRKEDFTRDEEGALDAAKRWAKEHPDLYCEIQVEYRGE